jgi:hypothetical protein
MADADPHPPVRRVRDGRAWRIGTDADVAWIVNGTSQGLAITSAVPPVFDAYATIVLPGNDEDQQEHNRAVLALLGEESGGERWWLGYLDTGADDIIFPDAPVVTIYAGWHYVLVEAGPEQAATWRSGNGGSFQRGALPDLMFPVDRSWLLSTLWDDDWACIGGPASFVGKFLRHPRLQARAVELGEDATPPGHQAF